MNVVNCRLARTPPGAGPPEFAAIAALANAQAVNREK